jgi:murein DD-endopeptidase MepM/ murein hydrolase activator NlpD
VIRTRTTVILTATLTSLVWCMIGPSIWGAPPSSAPAHSATPTAPPHSAPAALSSEPAPPLTIPVAGVTPAALTDSFSDGRGGGTRSHRAIDVMAPLGATVIAAAPGRIEKLFFSAKGGQTIYQRAPDGRWIYYYAHLSAYAPGLAEGQELRAGQPIGAVGASGDADPGAPHLHFQLIRANPAAPWYQDGEPVNPYPLLRGR